MLNDEDKARAALTAARAEQEKPVGTGPSDAGALCVLGLIDAALGQRGGTARRPAGGGACPRGKRRNRWHAPARQFGHDCRVGWG